MTYTNLRLQKAVALSLANHLPIILIKDAPMGLAK